MIKRCKIFYISCIFICRYMYNYIFSNVHLLGMGLSLRQNLGHLRYSETCVQRPPVWKDRPVTKDCFGLTQDCILHIYIKPVWKDHLPYKTTFVQQYGWSYHTGFTVNVYWYIHILWVLLLFTFVLRNNPLLSLKCPLYFIPIFYKIEYDMYYI